MLEDDQGAMDVEDDDAAMAIDFINFDGERSEISELDDVNIDVFAIQDGLDQDHSVLEEETPEEDDIIDIDLAAGKLDSDSFDDDSTINFDDLKQVSDMEIDNDYDEAVTQYELAKVFVDLGDEEGARKILNDIINKRSEDDLVYKDSKSLLDSIDA